MLNKLRENEALQKVGSVLYYLLVILIVLILIVVLLQRVSKNNFAIGGIRIFNIVSESMVPKYNIGDILVAKTIDPSQIKVGDDIAYQGKVDTYDGKVITHQVIKIETENGKYKFHTKGIANDLEDPVITQDQVYGKIVYHTVILSLIGKTINNLFGFYFLIFVPLTILIIIKIRDIVIAIKERKEDDSEDDSKDSSKDNNTKEQNNKNDDSDDKE